MTLTDENAFGVLIAQFDVEAAEYSATSEEFLAGLQRLRETLLEAANRRPLGDNVTALDFGHGVYFEVAEGDEGESPIAWLRALRGELASLHGETIGVVAHGGRWVEEGEPSSREQPRDGYSLFRVSHSSEPLRRALLAEAATLDNEQLASEGWGPGMYVDAEAVEALSLKFKNEPTPLPTGCATFYRAGR